jgi:predicted amidohydrolase YtcJ
MTTLNARQDLKGGTVMPGFVDMHRHMYSYAERAYGGHLTEADRETYNVVWTGVREKQDVLNQMRGIMERYKFKLGA